MTDYTGCDSLRNWLIEQGFKVASDTLHETGCNWYAYRRSSLPARECECNEGKPMQIVARPFSRDIDGVTWESVEVDVTGEAIGMWFKLMAYSLPENELKKRLPEIEASLIAAWNALENKP